MNGTEDKTENEEFDVDGSTNERQRKRSPRGHKHITNHDDNNDNATATDRTSQHHVQPNIKVDRQQKMNQLSTSYGITRPKASYRSFNPTVNSPHFQFRGGEQISTSTTSNSSSTQQQETQQNLIKSRETEQQQQKRQQQQQQQQNNNKQEEDNIAAKNKLMMKDTEQTKLKGNLVRCSLPARSNPPKVVKTELRLASSLPDVEIRRQIYDRSLMKKNKGNGNGQLHPEKIQLRRQQNQQEQQRHSQSSVESSVADVIAEDRNSVQSKQQVLLPSSLQQQQQQQQQQQIMQPGAFCMYPSNYSSRSFSTYSVTRNSSHSNQRMSTGSTRSSNFYADLVLSDDVYIVPDDSDFESSCSSFVNSNSNNMNAGEILPQMGNEQQQEQQQQQQASQLNHQHYENDNNDNNGIPCIDPINVQAIRTKNEKKNKKNRKKKNQKRKLLVLFGFGSILVMILLVAVAFAVLRNRNKSSTFSDSNTNTTTFEGLEEYENTTITSETSDDDEMENEVNIRPTHRPSHFPLHSPLAVVSEAICNEYIPGSGLSEICTFDQEQYNYTKTFGGGTGNLVAYAIRHQLQQQLQEESLIVLQNAGMCATDIANGNFTKNLALLFLPVNTRIIRIELYGYEILAILETALEKVFGTNQICDCGACDECTGCDCEYPYGSGIRFHVNATSTIGHRLSNVEVLTNTVSTMKNSTSSARQSSSTVEDNNYSSNNNSNNNNRWLSIEYEKLYPVVINYANRELGHYGYKTFLNVNNDLLIALTNNTKVTNITVDTFNNTSFLSNRVQFTNYDVTNLFLDFVWSQQLIENVPLDEFSTQSFIPPIV